ncbi:hypothetical protein ccbrp13_15560 [Ktedonobacteria bacterium brp13]|nr:hypothetical protein ccbrp13_15560 [Ktedonobacteria bacterium brp13]
MGDFEHHILALDSEQVQDYGQVMRYYRKQVKHWTAEQLGELYGNLIYRHPISGRMIQLMEKNSSLPADPKRREIMARLLGIPMAMFGLETVAVLPGKSKSTLERMLLDVSKHENIDTREYAVSLDTFWDNYYTNTAEIASHDVIKRIRNIHNALPYVSSIDKNILMRLLCGFHIALANIAHDHRNYQLTMKLTDNALTLAKENSYYDLQADVLALRGHAYRSFADTFPDQANVKMVARCYTAALQDYTAITVIDNRTWPTGTPYLIGPKMSGFAVMMVALTQSLLSQESMDIKSSLTLFDEVEKKLDVARKEGGSRAIRFDIGDFHYDKACMLISSPVKSLRSPDAALEEMSLAADLTPSTFQNRYVGIYERQARMYIQKGYYPIATALAQNSLSLANQLQENLGIVRIERLYNELKASSFGNSFEVAQLGASLMKVQYPHLFDESIYVL